VLRALVTAGFLTLALVILTVSFVFDVDPSTEGVLVNLGTEIIGIVITVSVVEWFFERRRLQNRARQLAWDAMHAVEHAVWVWQGGPREMDSDEVLGLLNAVGEHDPLPDFTEGLFLNIGTRSRRLLNNELQSLGTMPGFMNGLEHLARLSSLRDGDSTIAPRKLADILDQGTKDLARALGKPTERHLASLIRYRDPSTESQERRHYGGAGPLPSKVVPSVD
jgi:hypothetical protein